MRIAAVFDMRMRSADTHAGCQKQQQHKTATLCSPGNWHECMAVFHFPTFLPLMFGLLRANVKPNRSARTRRCQFINDPDSSWMGRTVVITPPGAAIGVCLLAPWHPIEQQAR